MTYLVRPLRKSNNIQHKLKETEIKISVSSCKTLTYAGMANDSM